MNILITGNLSTLAKTLAQEFSKDRNKIILVGDDLNGLGINAKNVSTHSIDPAHSLFQDVMAAYNFDIVIYLAAREEQLLSASHENSAKLLDGLKNALELSCTGKVKRFFYVSSTEVYGNVESASETTEPEPASINGYTLLAGERYCKWYHQESGLNTITLRVPLLYGPGEASTFLHAVIGACKEQKDVSIPTGQQTRLNFLHVNDVADFIKRAIDETYRPEHNVINLSSSATRSCLQLTELLREHFPAVEFSFDEEKILHTRPVEGLAAKKYYDWVDVHDLNAELRQCVSMTTDMPPQPGIQKRFFRNIAAGSIKWIELFLGAALMQFLSEFTSTLIQFKYVDFRLLFVVLMGFVHGFRFGIFAALLASLSILYTWYSLGYDWALLTYNVGNWFPFAVYFGAGIITGYQRDKSENEIVHEREQKELIYEKYQFLYGVFEEVRKLKDELREKIIGYRDSFGKIYTITRELGSLHEQVVFAKALNVMETLLANENIAIYSLDTNKVYARLEVNSYPLNEKIAKSLRLSDFPQALENIEHGQIFQNTSLLPNYPAYIAPVMKHAYPFNVPVAIIVIWYCEYEQYSTYYYNLFKVICDLVQDSLSRAAAFMEVNAENMYLPGTKILNADAFYNAISIREEMRKNKIADYRILRVDAGDKNVRDFSAGIVSEIRAADSVGIGYDGKYYVLLSQANANTVNDVRNRFMKHSLVSEVLASSQFLFENREKARLA